MDRFLVLHRKDDWDWDYIPDEAEEGDLPVGDDVQGWRPIYGVAMLLGVLVSASCFSYRVYVAAQRGRRLPQAETDAESSLTTGYRRIDRAA